MTETLSGKVVVITGASKGMGRVFTETLVRQGAKVAALARASNALEALGAAHGEAVLTLPCDIAEARSVRAAIDQAAQRFGRIDALVNNAAISTLMKVEAASDADIDREFAVNLLGPIYATSAAIPHLRAAGGGDLVFVSSESIRRPYPFLGLYAASKAGLETAASGLRDELREQGTRVTVLRSGYVATGGNLGEGWPADMAAQFFAEANKMGLTHFSGTPAEPEPMAQALLAVLCLPRDVNIDLIEARGRAPARV